MSIIHFKYHNAVDGGTVSVFSSQLTTLPATNVQNGIKSKIWRTEDDFVVSARNNLLPFHNSKSADALSYAIPSATYTGATLAAKIQSGLNATGDYTDHLCSYAGSKFTIKRSSTSDGFLRLSFDDPDTKDDTIAVLLGFDHATGYNSADRIYTSTVAVLGNEHEINIDLSATQTVSAFIVDNHNLTETGTMILRGATQSGLFSGPYNLEEGIALSTTVTITSGLISLEPSAPEIIIGGDCEGVPTEFMDNGDCEGGNAWREMIDRGDCESTTSPMLLNETVPLLDNATWARSAEQKFAGSYSYKYIKAVAVGTTSRVYLTDSTGAGDMHGFVAGRTYKVTMKIYIPVGGVLGSEIIPQLGDSVATTNATVANTYGSWQTVTFWHTMNPAATLAIMRFSCTGEDTEFFYVDDISFEEVALPIMRGEAGNFTELGKVELSDIEANGGTYSMKCKKTSAAAAGIAYFDFSEESGTSDMHGTTVGKWYKFKLDVFVPSSGGPQASEVFLRINTYKPSAWGVLGQDIPTGQDAWEPLEIIAQIQPTTTAVRPFIYIASAAAANELIYVDNVSFEEITPPMVRGEITPLFSNASGTFSMTQAAGGTYSFKITKNSAAGAGVALMYFVDNASKTDLHGVLPGTTYTFTKKVFIPTGTAPGRICIQIGYSTDGTTFSVVSDVASLQDQWETLSVTKALPSNTVGFFALVMIHTNVDSGDIIYIDDVSLIGEKQYRSLQLYWHDRTLDKSEIGRIWAGEYFEPAGKQTNTISFNRKTNLNRSTVMVTQSGAAFFNKKQKIKEWLLSVDPLDQYYNNTTKVGYEDMLDEVENHTPFYISFEDQLYSSTVYGYLVGNNVFNRNKNTPMFNLRDLVFREQK